MRDSPVPATPGLATLPTRRTGAWWALPFVLSLLFVLALAAWLQWSDRRDLEEAQRTLITDALSMESRLSARLEGEQRELDTLAAALDPDGAAAQLAGQAGAVEGLQRLWRSLTWLDEANRLRAQLPEQAPQAAPPGPARVRGLDDGAQSAHLWAPLHDARGRPRGQLVARYAPAALLRQAMPWWLARRYDLRLVDGWGQTLGATAEGIDPAGRESHRVSLEPALPDVFLELLARERHVPWWRTLMPVAMGAFLLLAGAATLMLRRQVKEALRAEGAWRTEAAWRRAMEDSLSVGLRARDLEGRLVYVNRTFCEQVGFSAEELLGRVPPMPYWPPDAIEASMQRHRRNLAGGAPRGGYESRWVRRDGQAIDVMILEAPLVDANGRHVGWMGSSLDITERKRLAERERRQTEAMAHQARLTTLGEVASALAHQLNQPLTAIAGYNAGVQRSLERAGFGDEVVLEAVRRLGEQATEAGRIVQRIREFVTRRGPQREPCDLEATARRAVGLLQRDLQTQGVALQWQVAPRLPLVQADPVLIEQVLINLVRNACDAMASHGTAAPRLAIGIAGAGPGFVRLDVEDAGPGLRGKRVDELCAPFYTTKADGMGMGLAICRSVIEAHGGAFDAGASPLGGARLSFTLPLAAAAPAGHPPQGATPAGALQGQDDDEGR